uniref:Uncharacterized protein n=1 Tax=Haptolina ericina TaxID=156174 RepID=A0A7S3F219_9EUKA
MDINRIVEKAEQNLLSTTPGAVPPHVDDGGHLPYGGTIGGTRGPSAFGKKRLTTKGSLGNPQAQLLNYPPEASAGGLGAWERNYKSSIWMDPAAEASRLISSNHIYYGANDKKSYLADGNQTWGDLRRTACTRPTPAPKFYPPPREGGSTVPAECTYTWKWPVREDRPAAPTIQRPDKISHSFLEEYELRPPWLKY